MPLTLEEIKPYFRILTGYTFTADDKITADKAVLWDGSTFEGNVVIHIKDASIQKKEVKGAKTQKYYPCGYVSYRELPVPEFQEVLVLVAWPNFIDSDTGVLANKYNAAIDVMKPIRAIGNSVNSVTSVGNNELYLYLPREANNGAMTNGLYTILPGVVGITEMIRKRDIHQDGEITINLHKNTFDLTPDTDISLTFDESYIHGTNEGEFISLTGKAVGTAYGATITNDVTIRYVAGVYTITVDSPIVVNGQTLPAGALLGEEGGKTTYTYPPGTVVFGAVSASDITVIDETNDDTVDFTLKTGDNKFMLNGVTYEIDVTGIPLTDVDTSIPIKKATNDLAIVIDTVLVNATINVSLVDSLIAISKTSGITHFGPFVTDSNIEFADQNDITTVGLIAFKTDSAVFNVDYTDGFEAKMVAGVPTITTSKGKFDLNGAIRLSVDNAFTLTYPGSDILFTFTGPLPHGDLLVGTGFINDYTQVKLGSIEYTPNLKANVTIVGADSDLVGTTEQFKITTTTNNKLSYAFNSADMQTTGQFTCAANSKVTNNGTITVAYELNGTTPGYINPTASKTYGFTTFK